MTKPKQDYHCPYPMRLGDKIVLWALGIALAVRVIQSILGIN